MDQGVFDAFLCETHYREAISIDQADNAVKYLKEEALIREADENDANS